MMSQEVIEALKTAIKELEGLRVITEKEYTELHEKRDKIVEECISKSIQVDNCRYSIGYLKDILKRECAISQDE